MSKFWNELVKRLGPREDIVIVPGAPAVTNKHMACFQKRVLMPQLCLSEGKIVLDVGTGIGRWALLLADEADQVIGIDISREMIKIAKERVKNSNVNFVVATAEAIPLRSNSVDLSLSCTCLQHISEKSKQKKGLHEITRVTKSKILILELMSKSKRIKLTHYPTLIIPRSEYVATLKKFGAKEVDDVGVDFLPFVKLIENLRNFLIVKLSLDVPSYGGSLKQRLLRNSYQIISVFALYFSLPFIKLITNPSSDLTRHTLLVAKIK